MSRRYFCPLTIILVLIVFLLPLIAACGRDNTGSSLPLDNNALATAAAETLQAQSMQATLQAGSAILTAQAGGQAPPAQQPAEPPAQPPAEPPAQPPAEPPAVASAPVIVASVDTNCRTGPGSQYDKVGYLGASNQAIVIGKEPSGNFWLINNPQNPSETCWVWTETTTLTGDESAIPLVESSSQPSQPQQQPEPPAQGDFMSATAKFSSIVVCSQKIIAIFEVSNTSSLWIKSARVVLQETATHKPLNDMWMNRPFLQAPQGCPPGVTDLKAGSQGFFGAKLPPSVDVGDGIDATITLCSEPNKLGECTSVLVQFIIPAAFPQPPGL